MKTPYLLSTPTGIYLVTNEAETIQSHLLRQGCFEPAAAEIADRVSRVKAGAVVDVGANIGTFSIHLATRNREVEILAFEPQRLVYCQLCANVVLNNAANVKAFNLAIGASGGSVQVPVFDPFVERYTGSVTLDPEVSATRATIRGVAEPNLWAKAFEPVRQATLSALLADQEVCFLKIDVEGMELDVLHGAAAVLARSRPVIFSEAWALAEFAARKASIFEFLHDSRYLVREIGDDFVAIPVEEGERIGGLLAGAALPQ